MVTHAKLFSQLGAAISKRKSSDGGEQYCLTSPEFDALEDADAAKARASKLLERWNGVARLMFGSGPVGVQQIHHRGACVPQTLSITLSLTILPAETAERQELAKALLTTKDPIVTKILGLTGNGPKDWVNGYRVFEVIAEECSGVNGIASRGWASKADLTRFKRTANHPEASGPSARHGVLNAEPPAMPMSHEEASALMNGILHSFLKAKLASSLSE